MHVPVTPRTGRSRRASITTASVLAALLLAACADAASTSDEAPDDGQHAADVGAEAGAAGLVPVATPQPPPDVEPLPVESSTWDGGLIELADATPIRDWGVAAAPTTGGPYPVAVLLHGSHFVCREDAQAYGSWPCPDGTENPHHEGLTYLAEAVAARGFVVAVPGTNAQHTFGAGEPEPAVRSAEIADRALTALAAGERGVDAALVDAERIVVIGHSVGAQEAAMLAAGVTSFSRPVAGVVLLLPALWAQEALPLVDVPAVVVIGECDGDTGVTGANYVSDALLATRQAPAALISLAHVTHNAINTGLPPDPFPVTTPGCTDEQLMPAEAERELFAAMVPELALAVLGDGGAGWAGIVFDDPQSPDGVEIGVVPGGAAVAALPGASESVIADLELAGITATFCPFGYYTPFVEPDRVACHRPELPHMVGQPRTLALTWDEPGASMTVPLEARAGDILRLRIFPDVAAGFLGDAPVQLRLTVPGGASVDVEVPVPPYAFETMEEFDIYSTFAPWQTFAFEVTGDVAAVELTLVEPGAGGVQLVSLGID